ncbi:Putative NADPH-quinone reductase (modulator of drug activity B) [Paenibacillus catalpae]|uniref:Putative NADPH-quinone reductase (Modulator of drug activity B) n=1 Tax=Paenibacillus catalpae TaxID=1045775 RepID=A0A1I1UZU7_9BACL|nr:NAD(P)H-dependent oxidoreductase [Paenibacillus catalpae]SFD76342.1 Putative NADPH-quinone reductase (modulator of drug activity B) [Paenibacillus catalpae]
MKTLVIVTHPNMEASRVNKAWVEELKNQGDVTVHELYKAYPDENIDVAKEQQLVEAHDRIIFQFPLFWYSTPALLKKWFDSVLQYGWAFGPDGDKTKGKEIGVAVSTYGSEESYQRAGFNRFTVQEILRPIEATAHFISASYLPHFTLNDVSNLSDERLAQSRIDYVHYLKTVKPVVYA